MCSQIIIKPSMNTVELDGKCSTRTRSYGEVVDFVLQNQHNTSIVLPAQWHRYFLAQQLYRPLLHVVSERHLTVIIPEIIFACTRNDLCHTSPAIAAALMEPDLPESRQTLSFNPKKVSHVKYAYAAYINRYKNSEPRL